MSTFRVLLVLVLLAAALGCKKKSEPSGAATEGPVTTAPPGPTAPTGQQPPTTVEPAGGTGEPTPPPPAPTPEIQAAVCAGEAHACILKPAGDVVCFGANLDGELGDGTAMDRDVPVPVVGITDAKQISCGLHHTCALRRSGEVSCWGRSYHGQLGNDSIEPTQVPVAVGGLTGVAEVRAGGEFTCARLESGQVKCWGNGGDGRLGNGARDNARTPVDVTGIADAQMIAVGVAHGCALRAGGKVSCWGDNTQGALGNGDANVYSSETPVDVVELTGAKAIAAGNAHTCAVVDAGVKCWGSNDEGQIGDGNKGYDKDVHKPTDVKDLGAVAQIELGSQAGCARLESGEIRCWGYNNYTAQLLGTGSEEEFVVPPAPVKGLADAVDVSVGYNLACAVRRTGAVACWGEGGRGQLGIGEREKQFGPNEVAADAKALSPAPAQPFAFPPAEGVAVHVVPHIAQGYDHVCGVTAEGRVLCFGDGGSGQLGVGSTQGLPSNLGRVVPGITDAIQVSAAMQRTCVLRANGQVACWGDLGYANTSLPMPIDGITDAVEVSVGGSAYGLVACVRHVDRTVSCWGQNNSGELGNDTREASETPVKIPGLEDAAQLAVSLSTVCVRRESGKVACWGSNYYGELGNDSEEGSYVPADVPRLSRVTDLTASTGNVCAVAGGQVQCWGSNGDGQIGNGKVDADNPVRKPTAAAGVRNAVRVSTGDTSCAVLRDGKVMCWGDNAFGQVGIADTETDEVTRARALDLQDPTVAGFGAYVMYGCGRLHCCGLHADGHVSCTGTTPINGGADFFGLNAVHSAFPVAAPGIQFPATTPAQ